MATTTTKKIDYLAKAAEAADKLYPKIVSLRCTHASGAKTYAQLLSAKKVTCASSASIAYQLAGILASGDVVGHRDAVGGSDTNILRKKSTVAKAMTGVANLPQDKVERGVGRAEVRRPAREIPAEGCSLHPGQQRLHLCWWRCDLQLQRRKGQSAGQQGALQGQQDHQRVCVQFAHPSGCNPEGEGGAYRDKTAFYGRQPV